MKNIPTPMPANAITWAAIITPESIDSNGAELKIKFVNFGIAFQIN
jgi:hypothetical protein